MNPQQIFSWEFSAAMCSWYFSTLLAVVLSGIWWVWSVFSFTFLCEVHLGQQEDPFLILGDTEILSLLPLFNTSKGACGTCRGCWVLPRSVGEEKGKSFGLSFPKLFFSDLTNTVSSRLFSHFLKSWSFQSVFPELCRVISCLQHLKEKCGASETSLLFAVFTTN